MSRRSLVTLCLGALAGPLFLAGCGGGGGGGHHTTPAPAHAFNAVDAGQGAPAFDWTYHVDATIDIPFVEYGFQIRANGATGATAERTLANPVCYALHVMQKFNFSPNTPQGTVVGRITVVLVDGTSIAQDLVAGVNTADFAYDKYVAQGITPAHLKPSTPYAQPTTEGGIAYDIRHFYLKFDTADTAGAPRAVQKIVLDAYLAGEPGDFGVDLYGLTLEQDATA